MAKIRCRQCDICGVYLDDRDFQFWCIFPHKREKRPKIYMGAPALGMKRLDLCDNCGAELHVQVQQAVKKERKT